MTTLLLAAVALASPHAAHRALALGAPSEDVPRALPAPLPQATDGPDRIVYGYEPYWNADLQTVPWDDISHLAIFSADATPDGTLVNRTRFDRAIDAVAIAEAYGVRVHLCVTNFDTGELSTLLGSPTARADLIDALAAEVERTGAHGVNVDFEGLPASRRAQMVTFIRDLDAAVDEVVVAIPAVDWSDAWDHAALAAHAHLFLMGYGYHWAGSDYAGPVDPLYGGGVWSPYSLDWSVRDILDAGTPPDRLVLGLPLYGFKWPVAHAEVPAPTTGRGSAVVFATAWDEAAVHGPRYDASSETPYYDLDGEQAWYGDTASVRLRLRYADTQGLGGIGFWALHYTGDDPDFWRMIHDETAGGAPPPPDDGALVANAGRPFLAYVGDTIVLDAGGSLVPADGATYRWTQVGGPPVAIAGADAPEARFLVDTPGVHVFTLEVGDGTAWSPPDRTHVVVLDRRIGRHYRACGWSPTPIGGLALVFVGAAVLRRRR